MFRLERQRATLVRISLALVILSSPDQARAEPSRYTPPQQFAIYASSVRHSSGFNKFAYFSEQMKATAEAYRKNPRQFDYRKFNDATGEWVAHPRGLDEVLTSKALRLRFELRPTNLTLVSDGISYLPVPAWVAAVGKEGLKFLPEFNNKNPVLSRQYQDAAIEAAFVNGQAKDKLAAQINEAAGEWLGVDTTQDLSGTDPVVRAAQFQMELEQFRTQQERIDKLSSLIKEARTEIEKVTTEQERLRQERVAAEEEARRKLEFERTTGEVIGALELFGYAARLMGDKDLALASSVAAFAFDRVATLSSAANMGALALTAGYIGVAIAVCDMVSKAQKGDATLEALSEVFSAIATTRKEMHERFDRVDQTLALMWNDLATRLEDLQRTLSVNQQAAIAQLAVVKDALAGQYQQLGQISYSLATSTRRLESAIAQAKRNDITKSMNIIKRGRPAPGPRELDRLLITIDTYITNDIRKPPFADTMADYGSLPTEQQLAKLIDPLDGRVDAVSGLQALLAISRSKLGQTPSEAPPNMAAWVEVSRQYLDVVRERGAAYPELVSSNVMTALTEGGQTILDRHQTIFGEPGNASDGSGRQLLLGLLSNYSTLWMEVMGRVDERRRQYEHDNFNDVSINGTLEHALALQRALPPIESGAVDRCGGPPNCDWVAKNFVGKLCLKSSPEAAKNCGPVAQCYDKAYYPTYPTDYPPLSSTPIPEHAVDGTFLLANRVEIAGLRTCWTPAAFLDSDPPLTAENEPINTRLRYSRVIYRLMFLVDANDLGAENVATYWVNTPCSFCMPEAVLLGLKANWQNEFKTEEDFQKNKLTHLWKVPGGGRDRFQENHGFHLLRERKFTFGHPLKGAAEEAEWKLFQDCFGPEPPASEAASKECFPQLTHDIDIHRFTTSEFSFPNEDLKHTFWTEFGSLRAPLWRIEQLRSKLAGRIEDARRRHRQEFLQDLQTSALTQSAQGRDGAAGLGSLLNQMDVRLAELRVALELGYSSASRRDDSLRGLFYGRDRLPGSSEIHAFLNTTDPDARQLERLEVLVRARTNQTAELFSALSASEELQPVVSVLSELRNVAGPNAQLGSQALP